MVTLLDIKRTYSDCYMTASAGSADALRAKKLALILGE